MPDKTQAKFSPFAFFLGSSDVKHKTERVQLIFWTLLTDAFIPSVWGNRWAFWDVKMQYHWRLLVELLARIRIKAGIVNY